MDQQDTRPSVILFTDGACIGNPGPGGWAFILVHPASGRRKELAGGQHATTNNRMEIMAVIQGMDALKGPSRIQLVSDSQYVLNGITGWIAKWKRFGWKKTLNGKSYIKNADLWQRLDNVMQGHDLTTLWVRGHDGHPENERCDQLAEAEAAKIAKQPAPTIPESPRTPILDGSLFCEQNAAEETDAT